MASTINGLIVQGIGGFYYVETADAVYECKARGAFRREGITPVAGDRVEIAVNEDGVTGTLQRVLPRRNVLVRPPVANLDQLAVVASVAEPAPHPLLLDKLIAIAEENEIEPIVVITKSDLQDTTVWEETYRKAGIPVFTVTVTDPQTADPLREQLKGRITAFAGNSGVGKSSLLNVIEPSWQRETGEISQKLGRGRHTTRSAELFRLPNGGYLADTAGFSALDMERIHPIDKERLEDCFREFRPLFGQCRFTGCAHVHEPDCAVKAAVEAGEICLTRYESYCAMYAQAEQRKSWEK
ncbi:MAG: ribosome small subunit-dependent GTPase A [Clostridia bacterium]|nr:ribosome small subunit-dependent GTPase A [Clostridia bacterium]